MCARVFAAGIPRRLGEAERESLCFFVSLFGAWPSSGEAARACTFVYLTFFACLLILRAWLSGIYELPTFFFHRPGCGGGVWSFGSLAHWRRVYFQGRSRPSCVDSLSALTVRPSMFVRPRRELRAAHLGDGALERGSGQHRVSHPRGGISRR